MTIGIVDYKAGNLTSVVSAISHVGINYVVSADYKTLMECDKLLFPGVGEASWAMKQIMELGLDYTIKSFKDTGKDILGICLGAQIILDHSMEGDTPCLGLVPGKAKLFPRDMGLKIPHIGWNTVEHNGQDIFKGIPNNSSFYFVHSYYVKPRDYNDTIGKTEYGIEFCSSIKYENIRAVQFHPEKSGEIGLQLLHNFGKFL